MYHRPDSLSDALSWLADHAGEGARIAAGCTDLFPATTASRLSGPILDITAIEELHRIDRTGMGWSFGGAVTWTDLIDHELPPAFTSLQLAAREVGSIQIQNAGTLAGNLCNASPAADGTPCWLTLDASVVLRSVRGARTLPLVEFMQGPRNTALAPDEILTEIQVPPSSVEGQSTFLKLGGRKYLVISIAMVAARLSIENRTVSDCAIAVGSCSGVPVRLPAVERALLGKPADPGLSKRISRTHVAEHLAPISDVRASDQYRRQAAAELVRRCIDELTHEAGEVAA